MSKSGQCHCGNITYVVNGEPVKMAQCHCNACRRITGTGHNVQAFFNIADVKISGKTATHKSIADSSNIRTRHFCPNCGSRLFSYNSKTTNIIGIGVGSFNETSWFKPEVILYNSERPIWDTIDESIEIHDLM